jgi:hypothetical protein
MVVVPAQPLCSRCGAVGTPEHVLISEGLILIDIV